MTIWLTPARGRGWPTAFRFQTSCVIESHRPPVSQFLAPCLVSPSLSLPLTPPSLPNLAFTTVLWIQSAFCRFVCRGRFSVLSFLIRHFWARTLLRSTVIQHEILIAIFPSFSSPSILQWRRRPGRPVAPLRFRACPDRNRRSISLENVFPLCMRIQFSSFTIFPSAPWPLAISSDDNIVFSMPFTYIRNFAGNFKPRLVSRTLDLFSWMISWISQFLFFPIGLFLDFNVFLHG